MLKLTKYTLFHYFKHNRGLVFIENNHFARFLEEISTINTKFSQPWVAWVAHFSMSAMLMFLFFWFVSISAIHSLNALLSQVSRELK